MYLSIDIKYNLVIYYLINSVNYNILLRKFRKIISYTNCSVFNSYLKIVCIVLSFFMLSAFQNKNLCKVKYYNYLFYYHSKFLLIECYIFFHNKFSEFVSNTNSSFIVWILIISFMFKKKFKIPNLHLCNFNIIWNYLFEKINCTEI